MEMELFEDWLNGDVDWPHPGRTLLLLSSHMDQYGRGLVSRTSISPGNCCLAIPSNDFKLVLTPFRCANMLNFCGCFRQLQISISLNPFHVLVLFFHHLIRPWLPSCPLASIWKPYVSLLPSDYTDPAFVLTSNTCRGNSAEPFSFRSHDIHILIQKSLARFQSTYDACSPLLFTPASSLSNADPAPVEFAWAWSTVNSRCVYCQLHENCSPPTPTFISSMAAFLQVPLEQYCERIKLIPDRYSDTALIPFFDFLNHCPLVDSRLEVDRTGKAIQLFVQQSFGPGEQVLINYGPHDNLTLFIEYGFSLLPSENPHNAVYPSNIDLLQLFTSEYYHNAAQPASTSTRKWEPQLCLILHDVLEQLGLSQASLSTSPVTWSSICFSFEGASFHLSLLSYCVHQAVLSGCRYSEIPSSPSARHSIFSLPEQELLPVVQKPLNNLAKQLLRDTILDEQQLQTLALKVDSSKEMVILRQCYNELKKVLLSRRSVLENFIT
ncbi:SET domain-containing protein 4 [Clonorchis sinensis]|uniref:SET domain-containing protein 4 n=1 Tax=Clonorchis sinensis TaxID=79923 RepID=A0A8T1MEW5_CLOSI|nr:SET domain-containing protein 4 [Clonorchis sinensis]